MLFRISNHSLNSSATIYFNIPELARDKIRNRTIIICTVNLAKVFCKNLVKMMYLLCLSQVYNALLSVFDNAPKYAYSLL